MNSPQLALRRNNDFLRLWLSAGVSQVGLEASKLALPLLVLVSTGSAALAGTIAGVRGIVDALIQIPAGHLADLVDRRRLMVWCDLGCAGTQLVLWGMAATGRVAWSLILLVTVAQVIMQSPFNLARIAAIRSVVRTDQLDLALSQEEARSQALGFLGPPLAGVLFGVSRSLPFLADAMSYLISAALVRGIKTDLRPHRAESGESAETTTRFRDAFRGVSWLMAARGRRQLLGTILVLNTIFSGAQLLLIVWGNELGFGAPWLGVIMGVAGGAAFLGAVLAPWILGRLVPRRLVVMTFATAAIALGLMGLAPGRAVFCVGAFLTVFLVPALSILVFSNFLSEAPGEIHGRVIAGVALSASSLAPLGAWAVGVAFSPLGGMTLALILAAIATLGVVVMAVLSNFGSSPDSISAGEDDIE